MNRKNVLIAAGLLLVGDIFGEVVTAYRNKKIIDHNQALYEQDLEKARRQNKELSMRYYAFRNFVMNLNQGHSPEALTEQLEYDEKFLEVIREEI